MTQKVLLLGSGFVAKPTVDILAAEPGVEVTVACRTVSKAKELAGDRAKAISLDVSDSSALDKAVGEHDLVISLIPYTYHAQVIESACRKKKHVVTTSYVSPAMKELEAKVKEAGIVVMNEIGLDPGIDHLYAVKTIEDVHRDGGKIKSFLSYCGGLPAPEDSDNPLGYKFSWSSRGVLLALRNAARFYQNGKVVDVEGPELMKTAKPYFIYPGYAFVAYPNRDSTPYRERYNIPEAEEVIRGTLRFQGFPQFVKVLVDLGFLDDTPRDFLNEPLPWNKAFAQVVGSSATSEIELERAISSKTEFESTQDKERILAGLRWLGAFSDTPITPRGNPLDTLCATLEEKMQFDRGERDLVMLQHKFGIEWADGKKEVRTSTLVMNGDPTGQPDGYSAMARLVGVPCAVAVKQILRGDLTTPGIHAPVTPELADPLRKELKKDYGIEMIEKVIS
ncbi:Saccharopine dehydrogenase [NADP(+), L-glutamate-forming] [Wickerhamiella sorbophila]|uniref:Saccharopine dehydrogenase [NADP(+), L-glutamate-forming] n=1 Tax=Wickerhamiella sorbophila TaxID=45607 RepID=A0A2T0FKU0_9ASCO|nr:Saccharopine dehydrogenase [NADP(+), L-glutamate-forming] [Wickerhamiella sorbophila]PRT55587.1 Saccharopine dehydrogenase [NADP(+), L-glutamate-forming] [Wickerhamiella sorbophila]